MESTKLHVAPRYFGGWPRTRTLERFSVLLTFVLCLAIIVLRNPDAVFRAEFWAEDATEFFFGSLQLGLKSLIAPVIGYHFFVARLIAYIATAFPVLWIPFIYAAACLFINAFVTAYFVRDGFSWIIPARSFRIFVCAVLAIGPGTGEAFLSLCNLPSVLSFFALLLLLEKPFRLSNTKFAILVVLLFSAGQMFVLAPIVGVLWLYTRDARYLWLLFCFVPVIAINAVGNHFAGAETNLRNYSNVKLVPRILLENFVLRLFFMPFLGDQATVLLMKKAWLFWTVSLTVVGCSLYLATKERLIKWEPAPLLILTYLCTIGVFAAIALSRNYALGLIVRESGQTLWAIRYSYLPGMVALIIWFAVLFRYLSLNSDRLKTFAAGIGVIALVIHNLYQWNNIYHRTDLHWPQGAEVLQKILDQRNAETLQGPASVDNFHWVHPAGWVPNHGKLMVTISPK